MVPYRARGGSYIEICLFLKEKTPNASEICQSPIRWVALSAREAWDIQLGPTSQFSTVVRLGSCIGSKESSTGLLLERTIGVCHLIRPPFQGQNPSRTNK